MIEEHSSPDAVAEAEIFFIAYFQSIGCRLTNMTSGGDGVAGRIQSEEEKKKRSESLKGHPGYWLGKKRPEEAVEKGRQKTKGQKRTAEQRQALSSALKGLKKSQAARRSMSRAKGGREVVASNGIVYFSATEAAHALDLYPGNVLKVLQGELKRTGKMTFRYTDEVLGLELLSSSAGDTVTDF